MRDYVHVVLLVALASCGGCRSDAKEPNAPQPAARPTRTIRVEEMRFPDPALGEKLRCFDEAANRLAGPTWHRRPYKTFPSPRARGVYFAEWATFAEDGRNPINYHGPKEIHCISLAAYYDADAPDPAARREIVGLALYARWKPAERGWGATLEYRTFQGGNYPRSNQPNEAFSFSLQHYPIGEAGPAYPRIAFNRSGAAYYARTYEFGGSEKEPPTMYAIAVSTHDPSEAEKQRSQVPDADVERILASPEVMRDLGLAAYRALLKKVEEEIPAGRALRSAEYARMLEYGEDPSALVSDRKLTEAEQQQILAEARRHVQLQIEALEKDYREMYAALQKAFPLTTCLENDGNED